MSSIPTPDPATRAALEKLVAAMAGVSQRPMFGVPGFFVAGKCFACVMGDGVAIKLGKARAQEVLDAELAYPMVVMDRTMGGWVVVPHDELAAQSELVDEAREVVEALAG